MWTSVNSPSRSKSIRAKLFINTLRSALFACLCAYGFCAGPSAEAQTSFPNPDLETCYLGFSPNVPGSSIQLDLRLSERQLRLTARTSHPANEFQDFNIDIGVVPASTWTRITTSATDRVLLTYRDESKNIQIRADVLMKPYWRAVLDAAPIDGARPIDNLPSTSGNIRWLLNRAPLADDFVNGGLRPMPFGVIKSVTPKVSIPVGIVTSSGGRVFLDDGWDDTTDDMDVTSLFALSGSEAVATRLPFRFGTNRLSFVFPDGQFEAFCQNYDNKTYGLGEVQVNDESSDFIDAVDGSASIPVETNGMGLFVPEGQPEPITSSLLRVNRLRPVGYAKEFYYYETLVFGKYLSGDSDNNGITDVLEYPHGAIVADPRRAHTVVDAWIELQAVSEIVPPANANNDADMGYDRGTHGWNDPAADRSGLKLLQEHFWMDTFAGHRLIASYVSTRPARVPANIPVVAVLDSGFGAGDAFPNADFPLNAFRDLWLLPGNNDARPEQINADGARNRVAVTAAHLQDPLIQDEVLTGHGTPVAHYVAGRGGVLKRGTAKDSLVTVLRMRGWSIKGVTSSYYMALLSQQIQDPQTRVINFSNGGGVTPETLQDLRRSSEYVFDRLSREGIISTLAAGNFRQRADESHPSLIAPVRGGRDGAHDNFTFTNLGTEDMVSPLVLRVSGYQVPSNPADQETPYVDAGTEGTGTGNNISVAASGQNVVGPDRQGSARLMQGTSFATPIVAGLASEVLRILDLRDGIGTPANLAARRGRVASALAAVEIVEATADRLNRNIEVTFDATEPADNDTQGFGRVNVFKAILSAVNGGLSAGGTVKGAAPNQFMAAPTVAAANTDRYGFLIRFRSNNVDVANRYSNATVWVNDNPYDDVINPAANLAARLNDPTGDTDFTGANGGAPVRNIIGYKRLQSLNSRLAVGFTTVGGGATGDGVQEMVFSSLRTDLTRAGGNKRLEIRQNADAATAQPFFSIPLDIAALRSNAGVPAGGNGTNIRFDDFVFEILVNHSVLFNRTEAVVGAGAAALAAANEVPLIVTVRSLTEAGVGNVPVRFRVVTDAGAESNATQIRLRAANGAGATVTDLTVNTANAGADQGRSTVWVTRIAAGANNANPKGVASRIRVEVPLNPAGGAATAQFTQEFTVPTR